MFTENKNRIKGLIFLGSMVGMLFGMVSPALAQEDPPPDDYTIQITQVDTSTFPQITVWVSVTDVQGEPVNTVPASAIQLVENGRPVEDIEVYQAGEQGPVTTVLTIDRSGSMNDLGKLEAAKRAAQVYVDNMRPEDAAGIVVFNTQVQVLQSITSDKQALTAAINSITAFDDTAMYDGLSASLDLFEEVEGRRVVILLSDGLDNRSNIQDVDILARIGDAGISVYTIGLGDPSAGNTSTSGIDEVSLQQLADSSRGQYAYTPDPDDLTQLYRDISVRLQNEYRLTYTSPNTLYDGINRDIEVKVAVSAPAVISTDYNPGGVIPETAISLPWSIFGVMLGTLLLLLAIPVGWQTLTASRAKQTDRVKLTTPGASKKKSSRIRLNEDRT